MEVNIICSLFRETRLNAEISYANVSMALEAQYT